MSILENKLGLWVNDTATAVGQLHAMKDLGFQYVAIKIVQHDTLHTLPFKQAALSQVLHEAGIIGLPVIAWAYVYPHLDISEQINVITSCLPPNCSDLILDAEIEWEGATSAIATQSKALATQLVTGLQALIPNTNLHLSSFYATDLNSTFPFAAFLAGCKSFMPQSYIVDGTPVHVVFSRTLTQAMPVSFAARVKFIPTVNVPDILDPLIDLTIDGANVWLWHDDGGDAGVQEDGDAWKQVIAKFQQKFGP